MKKLPVDLSGLTRVSDLNISGNPISCLAEAVESLLTMPALRTLQINLLLEDEVDYLLRQLPSLQYLNGIVVERDAIFSESESNMSHSVRNQTLD